MIGRARASRMVLCVAGLLLSPILEAAEIFRIATYNLENYVDHPAGTRPLKTPEARAKIRESLRVLNADVVALQEIGGTNALLELRASLEADGPGYPFWE